MLSLPPDIAPWIALATLAGMFVLFARDTYPTEVTALGGAALLLATGILPADEMLRIFENPAPWTIAAMFILSGGLVRTGALQAISDQATRAAETSPRKTLAALALLVVVFSAFMNNTPVVVVMIPIAMQLARTLGTAASRLLIPLSYAAILGGMCTLIGTSTNLLVAGVASSEGLDAFSLFEVTPLALILAVIGLIYLRIAAPRLLPDRTSMAEMLGRRDTMKFFTQVIVTPESGLIGKAIEEVAILRRSDMRVIDVIRGDESLRREMDAIRLASGDRLVLRTSAGEVMSLRDEDGLELASGLASAETTTVEVLITPGGRLIGRRLGNLRLRRRYGVYVLAVHRRDENIGAGLDDVSVRVGDTLLLEGRPEDIDRMAGDMGLANLVAPADQPYRRSKAPLVVTALAAVVIFSALGLMPIHAVAIIAVALILLTRCIDADEAFAAVDGRLLVLIFSMLAVGRALDRSGAIALIVEALTPLLILLPPVLMIWAVYLVTSILTELVSNTAVAVAMTPVAVSLAAALGVDPRPLVVAVMIAASASFATPIGYQTNTMVYGPGGYKFMDFVRIGLPLNLMMGIIAAALIPIFWPL